MKSEKESLIKKFSNFKFNINHSIKNFSLTEKVLFGLLSIIFLVSFFSVLIKINSTFLVQIPQKGGALKEGLIGTPRFINPVIAISDTDKDISSLVYSGLLKVSSDGELENDLAEAYTVSEDGLTYYIKIKDDAFFHDGKEVTVDDLIFTIEKTQDPTVKSPKRPNWDGVIIEKINNKEVEFILNQPYSPFVYNLTLGILPKHIWENISSDEFAFSKYNLEPIGSGPFMVKDVDRDSNGIAKKYTLRSYNNYSSGEPYLNEIIFYFYKNENDLLEALEKGTITSAHSISPKMISEINLEDKEVLVSQFSRIFALYFNQAANDVLANKTVREAIDAATPKQEIIDEILSGYANIIDSPVLEDVNIEENVRSAQEIFIENGWEMSEAGIFTKETSDSILELRFSISTANVGELVEVTEKLANIYRSIGADVSVKIFEPNDLTLNVIRPREFETIFFGQVVNRDLDYYAFWHSSQRNDPGLNLAGFTNIDADSALEKLRTSSDPVLRDEALQIFKKEVINEKPAVFLYSPNFIYIVPKNLKTDTTKNIVNSSDRFASIEDWYLKTDRVWKIFAK